MIETTLYSRLALLKQFYHKWHDFRLWLTDTRHLLKSSGKSLSRTEDSNNTLPNPEELTRLQVCVVLLYIHVYMLRIEGLKAVRFVNVGMF